MTETRSSWTSAIIRNPWLLAGGVLAIATLVIGVGIAVGNSPIVGLGLIFAGVVALAVWLAAAAIVSRR